MFLTREQSRVRFADAAVSSMKNDSKPDRFIVGSASSFFPSLKERERERREKKERITTTNRFFEDEKRAQGIGAYRGDDDYSSK